MSLSVSFVVAAKAFGRISRRAMEAPLTITHHGLDSLVLMSHAEYRRLKSWDGEGAAPGDRELSPADRPSSRPAVPAVPAPSPR